jgi:hypothetical protein
LPPKPGSAARAVNLGGPPGVRPGPCPAEARRGPVTGAWPLGAASSSAMPGRWARFWAFTQLNMEPGVAKHPDQDPRLPDQSSCCDSPSQHPRSDIPRAVHAGMLERCCIDRPMPACVGTKGLPRIGRALLRGRRVTRATKAKAHRTGRSVAVYVGVTVRPRTNASHARYPKHRNRRCVLGQHATALESSPGSRTDPHAFVAPQTARAAAAMGSPRRARCRPPSKTNRVATETLD